MACLWPVRKPGFAAHSSAALIFLACFNIGHYDKTIAGFPRLNGISGAFEFPYSVEFLDISRLSMHIMHCEGARVCVFGTQKPAFREKNRPKGTIFFLSESADTRGGTFQVPLNPSRPGPSALDPFEGNRRPQTPAARPPQVAAPCNTAKRTAALLDTRYGLTARRGHARCGLSRKPFSLCEQPQIDEDRHDCTNHQAYRATDQAGA